MKQISGFFIVFLMAAGFCTLQAQDSTSGDTAPKSGLSNAAFREDGIASWYGTEFEGHPTASGELFNPSQMTAAHPTLPFGTMLRVTNIQNKKQVIVRVNDRGPFVNTRIIDVSRAAAEVLDMISTGTAPVTVELDGEIPPPQAAPGAPSEPSSFDPWIDPIPAQPSATVQQPPAYPAQPTAAAPYPAQPEAYPVQPSVTPQQPVFPVQPPAAFSSRPADVIPKIPPPGTNKRYRVQVGAYTVTRNAVDAFDRVKSAGFEPAYERYTDSSTGREYYRVVISGIPADTIQNLAGRLGSVGFQEILIREE
jgi:rare lipoprotein A